MIFIENESITDPRTNLALEEYALRNFEHDRNYLLFYINEPSIIIGRNQNTLEEINHEYVNEKGIHVVRRISGGGAVYHDHGNLNFSFITNYDKSFLNNFKKFTGPVIEVLHSMGVEAYLSGRNDILVEGRKISGNAQFSSARRMFSHGTLLLNSNLGEVSNALNVKMSKIQSKGHKSVRSRVANISEFLPDSLPIDDFRSALLEGLYKSRDDFQIRHLTPTEWEGVKKLKEEKYDTWNWNYGHSPQFNIQRSRRFPIGEIDLRLQVEKGRIKNMKIYGDFLGKDAVEILENKFLNCRYHPIDIGQVMNSVSIEDFFGKLDKEDFTRLVYGSDEE